MTGLRGEPVPTSDEELPILQATPKEPDVNELQADLQKVGLGCDQTSPENLRRYISDVRGKLPQNPEGLQCFLIGKREPGLTSALSRPALEFALQVSRTSQNALWDRAAELSDHTGSVDFLRHILTGNPGGTHFVSETAGIKASEPGFFQRLTAEQPGVVQLLTLLALHDVVPTSTGTWVPDASKEYIGKLANYLTEILNQDRFTCLRAKPQKQNKPDTKRGEQPDKLWMAPKYQQLDRFTWGSPTAQVIKDSYVGLATNATSFLDLGIEPRNLVSILSNKIAGLQDPQLTDYHPGPQELIIYLVQNPEMHGGKPFVDGAGALSIIWDLFVKEYKDKKKTRKDAWMDVWLRAAVFESYYDFNGMTLKDQMQDDIGLCP